MELVLLLAGLALGWAIASVRVNVIRVRELADVGSGGLSGHLAVALGDEPLPLMTDMPDPGVPELQGDRYLPRDAYRGRDGQVHPLLPELEPEGTAS